MTCKILYFTEADLTEDNHIPNNLIMIIRRCQKFASVQVRKIGKKLRSLLQIVSSITEVVIARLEDAFN